MEQPYNECQFEVMNMKYIHIGSGRKNLGSNMWVLRIFLLIFVICIVSNDPCCGDAVKSKKFRKPCFVGDEIENTCSDPSESCHQKMGMKLKLVRLDGVRVNINITQDE